MQAGWAFPIADRIAMEFLAEIRDTSTDQGTPLTLHVSGDLGSTRKHLLKYPDSKGGLRVTISPHGAISMDTLRRENGEPYKKAPGLQDLKDQFVHMFFSDIWVVFANSKINHH